MEQEFYYVWLSIIPNMGYKLLERLLKRYNVKGVKELYELKEAKDIFNGRYKLEAIKMYKKLKENNIQIIHLENEYYPDNLKCIYSPPLVLYGKGNIELLKKNKKVAIVGSREASEYGKKSSFALGKKLSNNNTVIVSGLAKGIDEYSHIGACENNMANTIAVIGTGLDKCYPPGNKYLERRILEKKGLILSEFVLGIGPQKHHFPMRNRIIAGIANSLIVVEAKKNSGSMITVDLMLEEGKEVFVVPGPVGDSRYEGTNRLIKDGANVLLDIREF